MNDRKNKVNILYTFDYEVFLGKRSGTVSKCVIEPTQLILDVLNAYKAKAIFFVDAMWLVKLKEVAAKNQQAQQDYDSTVKQLQQIATLGHYIFPHIHPHWLNAEYITAENQWQFVNYTNYAFRSLNAEEKTKVFKLSIAEIKSIIEPVKPGYMPEGYRAGGWEIQPFDDFIPFFKQYGITYDFSVLAGFKDTKGIKQYDFYKILNDVPYRFASKIEEPENGDYVEFPISSLAVPEFTKFVNKILLKYLWINKNRSLGNGLSMRSSSLSESHGLEMISIELLTRAKVNLYLRFLKQHRYMHFISHPKILSNHNIKAFAAFLKKAHSRFQLETDFKKMMP